jgi:hypothetical protein
VTSISSKLKCIPKYVTVLFYLIADCAAYIKKMHGNINTVLYSYQLFKQNYYDTAIMYLYLTCSMSYGVNLYFNLHIENQFNSIQSLSFIESNIRTMMGEYEMCDSAMFGICVDI